MFKPKEPHGHVQGEGVGGAKLYQDGHYYDVHHKYLFSNPGIAPPPGKKLRTMEQAEADLQQRAAAVARGEAVPSPAPAPAAAPEAPTDPALTREQQLMQFAVPKLQQLQLTTLQAMHPDKDVATLKKELIAGAGAKQKLVAWLLESTTDT